jgi:hypothetical protein
MNFPFSVRSVGGLDLGCLQGTHLEFFLRVKIATTGWHLVRPKSQTSGLGVRSLEGDGW